MLKDAVRSVKVVEQAVVVVLDTLCDLVEMVLHG